MPADETSTLPLGQRHVLVTGATGGIGGAVVRQLVQRGSRVFAVGRQEERLRALEHELGDAVSTLAADLASPGVPESLAGRALSQLGTLDGVVCCAGVVAHEPLAQVSEAGMATQMRVNFEAPLLIARSAMDELADGGAIVFVTSTLADRPTVTSTVYSASKAALTAAMKSIALTGAGRQIRATAVSPGIVDTEMVRDRLASSRSELEELHALGRLGEAADVAQAILYALGAPWLTGSVLTIDGGLLIRT